ncbi:glycosyltransferase family 2 protein [Corticibacterium sp. UT-5YL-CI-8]|nr:glycosyltransferase family 2 protein [Tianweitania sp. UT-5YL-CI-8]
MIAAVSNVPPDGCLAMVSASHTPSITVIVSTYNWPEALSLSLQSLAKQTDLDFEIIVADDGSRAETANLIKAFSQASPVPVLHVWQEDDGFRKARILNQAIRAARGGYLVFLDGDCIAQEDFIARHRLLSRPGYVVTGSRILMSETLSKALCAKGVVDLPSVRRKAIGLRLKGDISKLLSLLLKFPDNPFRNYRKFQWRRIKGCNFSCWKSDALAVDGYDEAYIGWGHEDADFVFRLYEAGIDRRSGAFATEVLHIWHREADRSQARSNETMLAERIARIKRV